MAGIMRSTDFRAIVEPIMNKEFDGVYSVRKDEWKGIFEESSGIPRAYHEEPVLYGMGAAPEIPDGMPVSYDGGGVLFVKRYLYKVYGLAYAMTRILVEDGDHIRLGSIFSRHLANALVETKETLTANILNRAFNGSYVGGDGVSLINSAHPIVGGSFSNVLATPAALSQTSLEQILIQIRQAVDNNGKKITLLPKALIVHPNNMLNAQVILNSALRTGTANNDINPIKGIVDTAKVVSRLTSATAWFIKTDAQEGLKILMRRKMNRSMEGDFETDSMRYKGNERYAVGWTDPRAMFGTAGL